MNAIDLLERTETTLTLSKSTLDRMLRSCRKDYPLADFKKIFEMWVIATPLVRVLEIDCKIQTEYMTIIDNIVTKLNIKIKILK